MGLLIGRQVLMNDPVRQVEIFIVSLHQDGPYLGSLRKGSLKH